MKRNIVISIIGLIISSIVLSGCGNASTSNSAQDKVDKTSLVVLNIGASPQPHSEILKFVQPILKEQGVDLKITEFTDYVLPNLALNDGDIDANFFQHVPYMESFASNHNIGLEAVAKVHIEPLGLYSSTLKSILELRDEAHIAIPNDPTNGGRALLLLQKYGLIKLDDNAGLEATENDIVYNPKNLTIVPLDAPQLPRALEDLDAAVINTNYALEASLNPVNDALLLEDGDSPYANVLTVKPERASDENIQKLIKALNSPEVKSFIEEQYKGAIIPAF